MKWKFPKRKTLPRFIRIFCTLLALALTFFSFLLFPYDSTHPVVYLFLALVFLAGLILAFRITQPLLRERYLTVRLSGTLAEDPDLHHTPDGPPQVHLILLEPSGTPRTDPFQPVHLTISGNQADLIARDDRQGSPIRIIGNRKWFPWMTRPRHISL